MSAVRDAAVTDAAGPPVVLVHGWKDTCRKVLPLALRFRRAGRATLAPTLTPSDGTVPIEVLAGQLAAVLGGPRWEGRRIDLVGFSMGGIIARYFLLKLGGSARVRRFVTIAAPHRGTCTGWFSGSPGARQLRPGSPLLRDLERESAQLEGIPCLSVYTPLDLMIVPARSSVVAGMEAEAFAVPAHPWMVLAPAVQDRIMQFLAP